MDKKNVQNQECQKTFVKTSCVLYNKWPKGLKGWGVRFINAIPAIIKCVYNYFLREPMAPTTVAAGARAGTNVAATGRTRSATGSTFLIAGTTFFLMKFFWCGAAVALKFSSIFFKGGVYAMHLYYIFSSF